jgi:hypothetical protein
LWPYKKIEACILLWVRKWLSRRGLLILLKLMVQSIPVYWDSIAKIIKGILTKIQKKGFQFLWYGRHEKDGVPLVRWFLLSNSQIMGR